jgi:hypothetical protein
VSYGTPSKGLMQTIEPSFLDPLANMTAAVNYVRSEYMGDWSEHLDEWTEKFEIRPRQNGKSSAIERAVAISETVKPRPEMAEIMERAMSMPGGPRYAEGGIISSPTGRLGVPVYLSPGEHIMTSEMARASADRVLARMTGDYYTTEERAAMDEVIRTAFDEPPDDYPEPPLLPVW